MGFKEKGGVYVLVFNGWCCEKIKGMSEGPVLNSAVTWSAWCAALWHIHKIRPISSLRMHESTPYGTFHKAFLQSLCHLCRKGRTPGESCLHYNVVDHPRNHAMTKLQTGVQLKSDAEVNVFIDVAEQRGTLRSSRAGTVPRPWPWRQRGGRSWPGPPHSPTITPSGRSGAGPAGRSPPSTFHRGTWARRRSATGGTKGKSQTLNSSFWKEIIKVFTSLKLHICLCTVHNTTLKLFVLYLLILHIKLHYVDLTNINYLLYTYRKWTLKT